jgi:hypothetical protein
VSSSFRYVCDILTKVCVDIMFSQLADLQRTINLRFSYCADVDLSAGVSARNAAPTCVCAGVIYLSF